ncbi:hypothetical protein CEJ42_20710 [Herbaspirillum robiniae]|uniref:Uncharacterized protein n=1 Tax=Herbaspirillum robiniae TaxID=2014887 RepID=A0A246WL54_9BURK|nr:hypothetical protein CEJ42_20710 [Herbaspirillum robiniae]
MASGADPKGKFVFLQLPLVLHDALIFKLGLHRYFEKMSWLEIYLALVSPTFIFLYGVGFFIEKIGSATESYKSS